MTAPAARPIANDSNAGQARFTTLTAGLSDRGRGDGRAASIALPALHRQRVGARGRAGVLRNAHGNRVGALVPDALESDGQEIGREIEVVDTARASRGSKREAGCRGADGR